MPHWSSRAARGACRESLALAAAAWLALAGTGARVVAAPAAEPPPGGRRVLLLGLDGADWQAIDPLVAAGRLPAFARLRAAGRTGTLLATPPLVSPILWTTIATGRRPEDHRVLDFMVDLPSGGQAPVPSTERRVAALWNVFSEAVAARGCRGLVGHVARRGRDGTVVSRPRRAAAGARRHGDRGPPGASRRRAEAARARAPLVRGRDRWSPTTSQPTSR